MHNSSPEPVITEIEKIMDSGEGGLSQNVIKFQPISRLNSILVVSQKPEYLKRAQTWIARLDKSDTEGVNLKAYPLRYGNAKPVTALLNEMLTGRSAASETSLDSASSQISPGAGASLSSSGTNPVAQLSAMPTAASGATPPGGALAAERSRRTCPQRAATGRTGQFIGRPARFLLQAGQRQRASAERPDHG